MSHLNQPVMAPSDTPTSVPLSHYLTHGEGMGVEFRCSACQTWFEVPLEAVIARLQARGVGGPDTGVRDVARFAEKPCEACGGRRFETRPAWPRAPNTPNGHWS